MNPEQQQQQSPRFAGCQNEYDVLDQLGLSHDAQGATTFALLYGSPLVAYDQLFRGAVGLSFLGTNGVYSTRRLSTAADNSVVRTNVDTVYALSILDLAEQDVVVTVPPMQEDRFYLFSLYDP